MLFLVLNTSETFFCPCNNPLAFLNIVLVCGLVQTKTVEDALIKIQDRIIS